MSRNFGDRKSGSAGIPTPRSTLFPYTTLFRSVSWIKHSVDRFVIVSIFIPKLRLILILNSFLGSSDSLVFSELFHSLAPKNQAVATSQEAVQNQNEPQLRRSEERFSRNTDTEIYTLSLHDALPICKLD